ncbi:MAG: hypothetical protein ABFC18_03290 [Rikenellaceae bacterium]
MKAKIIEIFSEIFNAGKLLDDLAEKHECKYASFCTLVENEHSVDVYDFVCKAMEEYAALKVAEDRVEHMILEVKTTPTDEDIEKWAKQKPSFEGGMVYTEFDDGYKVGLIEGAKAMRDGLIKPKKCQE